MIGQRFTTAILGRTYECEEIDPGEFGTRAYRLVKAGDDTETYDVIRTHDELIECSCADYECRHRGTASVCKHIRRLIEIGKIEAPTPRPNYAMG